MIDDSDSDFAFLASLGAGPVLGTILLVLSLVLAFYACENKAECAAMHCPTGAAPKLLAHECLCVSRAK